MRKKLISKTYLRDVSKYKLDIYYDNDEYYLSVKKILKTMSPFILENGLCLINNNYYIVEVLPKFENYAMRVYFNEKKERLEYYFDISLKNGLDEESKIPYYDDLYTDITVNNGNIEVLDEDELKEALDYGNISKEEYDLANETKEKLLQSIKENNNKYMNLNLESYLKKIIKIKKPFILREENMDITIIDNGYYILEFMPFDEKYICRIHIDKNKKIIERFYIASKKNAIIDGVPVFEDLKISYVNVVLSNSFKFYNLEFAKKNLSVEDYVFAMNQIINVKREIENKSNYIYNLNYKKYLV